MIGHIHGKNAVIYIGAGGGEAINISEQNDWAIDANIALADVSQLNTNWKESVKGILDWSGACNGNFNLGSSQLWLAHISDVPEKMYVYPTKSSPTQYYYGTAWIQLTRIASGSTSAKASSAFKFTGDGELSING